MSIHTPKPRDLEWSDKGNDFQIMKGAHKGSFLKDVSSIYLTKMMNGDSSLSVLYSARKRILKIITSREAGKTAEPKRAKPSRIICIDELFIERPGGWLIMEDTSRYFGKYIHQINDLRFHENLLMKYQNLPQSLTDAIRLSMGKGNFTRKRAETRADRVKMTFGL